MTKKKLERVSGTMTLEFTMEWNPDDYGRKPTKKQQLKEIERDFKEFKDVGSFYYPKFKMVVKED